MINNKTYSTKATATRAAKRFNFIKFDVVPNDNGRFELRDLSRPLYNNAARVKSTVKGPVAIVWDLCIEHGKSQPRKNIVAMAIEAGVSINTAKSQYQSWRRAEGLVNAAA